MSFWSSHNDSWLWDVCVDLHTVLQQGPKRLHSTVHFDLVELPQFDLREHVLPHHTTDGLKQQIKHTLHKRVFKACTMLLRESAFNHLMNWPSSVHLHRHEVHYYLVYSEEFYKPSFRSALLWATEAVTHTLQTSVLNLAWLKPVLSTDTDLVHSGSFVGTATVNIGRALV